MQANVYPDMNKGETALFKVAEYIRLSREDGDKAESDSIVNQRRLIDGFLKEQNEFIHYDTYIDDGFTGTNFNRPAFLRMIADLEAGRVNCVIVKDLSRFGRDYIDTGKYLERYFPEREIRFISITDNIDSFKYSYDLLLPIKNIFNEQYARDISQKIHAAVITKQKAGEFIGAFASYGYKKSAADKNRLIIDEYAAAVVRRIFDLYLGGYGKVRIAGVLNGQGIVCPAEYKRLSGDNYRNGRQLAQTACWTYSTVNRLLQNEMYIGNMVQGKKRQRMRGKPKAAPADDWIVVPNTHEAIIDRTTWNKAQDLLNRRTRTLNLDRNVGIFAGFLKCGDCGRSMTRKENKYYCGTYVRSGRQHCTPHTVTHRLLEAVIRSDLQTVFRTAVNLPETVARAGRFLFEKSSQETQRQAGLTAELAKIRRRKKAVYEDYQDELISRDEYVNYRQDYRQKEALILKQLAGAETHRANSTEKINEIPWSKYLLEHQTPPRLDREIIVEMINEIKIYDDCRLSITYNFTNCPELIFNDTFQPD